MKSRILMVAPRFYPAIGGIEKHLMNVCSILSDWGYHITIVTTTHEAFLPSSEYVGRIRVIRMPYGWDKSPLAYIWFLKNRSTLKDFDVVHLHGTIPTLLWYLPLRLLHCRIPTFGTFHGFERDPVPFFFKILRRIARRLVKRSICVGSFIKKIYQIECDVITIGAVQPQRLSQNKGGDIIYIGRLEPDTGITEYINALAILKQRGIELKMTVVGDGTLRYQLEEIAHTLQLNVDFLGFVEDPTTIMADHSFCVAAGYLSILEAFSFGIPVICIARSSLKHQYYVGVREISGPISIQTSPEGVADELVRLINNPTLYKRISERSCRFAKKMTWGRIARTYLRMWFGQNVDD